MLHSCCCATGGNWYKSPMNNSCTPPKGISCRRRTLRRMQSIASITSARTMLISSMTSNSILHKRFRFSALYLSLLSKSSRLLCVGKNGCKGRRNRLCRVTPVSYTHLDVYKRQVSRRVSVLGAAFFAVFLFEISGSSPCTGATSCCSQ